MSRASYPRVYSKKKKRFKRSQSYNDAPGPAGSEEVDDGEKDFLDEEGGDARSGAGGAAGRGGSGLAAKGRNLFRRIARSGSVGELRPPRG